MVWRTADEYGITKRKSMTHADMVESYGLREDVFGPSEGFGGFLGGVEVDVSVLDELVPESICPADEEGQRPKWKEYFPVHSSLNGESALVRMCSPLRIGFPNLGSNCSWHGCSNDIFYALADHFGIENVMTKSEFQAKLDSPEYREPEII
jgi:hypothetical protein